MKLLILISLFSLTSLSALADDHGGREAMSFNSEQEACEMAKEKSINASIEENFTITEFDEDCDCREENAFICSIGFLYTNN